MAHEHQLRFVEALARHLESNWSNKAVLEVGSYDVNGSVRQFFPRSDYIGVDLTEGPGVDRVGEGDKLDYADDSFDACISCECFEHNPRWQETFLNMHRMTKKGGVVIVTCASKNRLEHGTTRTSPKNSPGSQSLGWDYYQNLAETDFQRIPNFNDMFGANMFFYNSYSSDLYFVGIKAGDVSYFKFDEQGFEREYARIRENVQLEMKRSRSVAKALEEGFVRALLAIPSRWSDSSFQSFAVPASRVIEALKSPLRKFLR